MPGIRRCIRAAALVAAAAALLGCADIRMALARKYYTAERFHMTAIGYESISEATLSNDWIEAADLEGPVSAGNVEAFYTPGLRSTAERVVSQADTLLTHAEEHAGFKARITLRYYLFAVDAAPGNVEFTYRHDEDGDFYAVPIFVETGREDDPLLLARQPGGIFVAVHELAEHAVSAPGARPVLVTDAAFWPFYYYTRWFRDGYANYAAYLAGEKALEEFGFPLAETVWSAGYVHAPVLCALESAGEGLFRWVQGDSPYDARNYSAALGLFLLLRERHGEEGIRRVMEGLSRYSHVDGRIALRVMDETLGIDTKKLVRDLRIAKVGLKAAIITPAYAMRKQLPVQKGLHVCRVGEDSPAARAGMKAGDIITAAGGADVSRPVEWELAVLKATPSGAIDLEVLRGGEHKTLTVELDTSGKRTRRTGRRRGRGSSSSMIFGAGGSMHWRLGAPRKKDTGAEPAE